MGFFEIIRALERNKKEGYEQKEEEDKKVAVASD